MGITDNCKINQDEMCLSKKSSIFLAKSLEKIRKGEIGEFQIKQAFERKLSAFTGVGDVILCSSGTLGIYVSLKALGVRSGDEVIVSSLTFPATINAIYQAGAVPVFPEIDSLTGKMQLDSVSGLITNKTKAIMLIHLIDAIEDIDGLLEIANGNKIPVIEDACQAFGASYKGMALGSLGDIGVFSFGSVKPLTTLQGGAIMTDNPSLAEKIKQINGSGIVEGNLACPGINSEMCLLAAALGLANMTDFNDYLKMRRLNYEKIQKILGKFSWLKELTFPDGFKSNYITLVLRVNNDKFDSLYSSLEKGGFEMKKKDISKRLSFYIKKGFVSDQIIKQSNDYFTNLIYLPLHNKVNDDVILNIKKVLTGVGGGQKNG